MQSKIVAIIRLPDYAQAVPIAQALSAGGIAALEFSLTGQGAPEAIARAAGGGTAWVGAGTVLSAAEARSAMDAGASFIVTPVVVAEVVAACRARGVPCICGAQTATEAFTAHQAGAEFVKIFPARLGGPAFLRDILAPLPFLKLVPTGGIDPDNAGAYLAAGAVAVGAASNLVPAAAVAVGDWAALTARAQVYARAVAKWAG
jgi:2-dehydro-3-deoxyphosphogluconate aldolase/(4S)-4-hydroxy-2-oxoglutarate aldolase